MPRTARPYSTDPHDQTEPEPEQDFYITETITWQIRAVSEDAALEKFLTDANAGYPCEVEERHVTPVKPQITREQIAA